jgi:CCR4-NOT transcription complex subunit 6
MNTKNENSLSSNGSTSATNNSNSNSVNSSNNNGGTSNSTNGILSATASTSLSSSSYQNNGNSNNNSSNGSHHNHSHHHHHHSSQHNHHSHHHHHHHLNGVTSNGTLMNGLTANGVSSKLFNNTIANNSTTNLLNHNSGTPPSSSSSSNSSSSSSNTPQQQFSMQTSAIANQNSNGILTNGYSQPSQADENSQKQISNQIPWFEIEIKGMVKNLSPKLWQWTHLRSLYLNDNNLMRLPPVVSSLVNLQCLDVSNNKIRTLPSEIGDMTSLRELYLNNNQIRVLPFELGKLFKLQQLSLKGNPLTPDIMQIYMEPNGSQKLLIHLLDQLTITCPVPPRRPWVILAEPNPNTNTSIFTTMCYNVLCDKYATRQYYGYCPAWALTWDYRKKLILEDIKNFNADIIALQELETEQFYNFFLPELKQYDYDGIFSPKSRAKTMSEQDKKHVDGCAIMFKTSRFQLVKDYLVEFNQIAMATAEGSEDMLNRVMTKDNIGLAALLEVKQDDSSSMIVNSGLVNSSATNAASTGSNKNKDASSSNSTNNSTNNSTTASTTSHLNQPVNNKQLLLICTAHIHWDPDYCDVKLIQTLMFTNEIKLIIEQATREFRPHQLTNSNQPVDCSSNIPVVICADLNSLPESGVIEYLRTGKILANHVDFKDLGYDSCLQKINTSDKPSELSHNLKLECAYDKEIMPYTNYTLVQQSCLNIIYQI